MIAALVSLDLHLPAMGSLKAKRGVLKALMAALQRDLNVSIAEVGHQDLWQRATIGLAIAAGSEVGARKVAQQVEKAVYREHRVEIISLDVEIVSMDD